MTHAVCSEPESIPPGASFYTCGSLFLCTFSTKSCHPMQTRASCPCRPRESNRTMHSLGTSRHTLTPTCTHPLMSELAGSPGCSQPALPFSTLALTHAASWKLAPVNYSRTCFIIRLWACVIHTEGASKRQSHGGNLGCRECPTGK